MKIRLFLSMLLLVIVTVISVAVFAMIGTAREVTRYISRGGMMGLNDVVVNLENHYKTYGTWEGVSGIIERAGLEGNPNRQGMGAGMQNPGNQQRHLILTDSEGLIIISTYPGIEKTSLDENELARAIPIRARLNRLVGYLYSDGFANNQPGIFMPLIEKLNIAAFRAGLIGVGIAIILSIVVGSWLLKPVTQLTKAAHSLGKGDLTARVTVRGKDELAQLGNTFNHMADSLQKAEQSRRNMTADIAHELRTPLAVQRASLEAMQDGVYPMRAENLQPVLEQNILLTRMVDDLRLLALADAGELRLEKVDTDLGSLVGRVVKSFQSQADQRKVRINYLPVEGLILLIDPIRVEQMITNIISNALRFTPEGGSIGVQATRLEKALSLSIHDSGPGIPDESLPYVFDRFYRTDKSRVREDGGSGLGLAIARQFARAQNGDITVRNHPQGGAEFTITFNIK
jgi:signal transduction histidine kinase